MNPYEADAEKIPKNDRYIREPLYGRYLPRTGDFRVDPSHILSTSQEGVAYWQSVLQQCDSTNIIYDNPDGGRDVFALGTIIVKSSHLKPVPDEGLESERDYALADANELKVTALVRKALQETGIQVPEILFAGKIAGRPVHVQSRIPGVGLKIAWQYLSTEQKHSFKEQARNFLQKIHAIQPDVPAHSYVVPDADPEEHRGIQRMERDILFGKQVPITGNTKIGLMHNDTTLSNMIVDNDRIVGVVDWEMAGFFSWAAAARVHLQIRTPKRENYRALNLPEEQLRDITYWNDLYDEE